MILNQGAYYLLAFAAIGTLLSSAIFIPNKDGALTTVAIAVKKKAALLTALWFFSACLGILLRVAEILDTSVISAFDSQTITSFLTQTSLGRAIFFQIVLISIVLLALPLIKRALPLLLFTLLAIVALTAPIFESHAAAGGSHALAIGALVVHVVAISLWVGGLFGITLTPSESRITALYRFSVLALWAAIAVVVSGISTAFTRLQDPSTWNSQYTYIILAKVVMTVALLAMGYANRKALQSRDEVKLKELVRLISVEAMVMASVALMGSWLSRIQPPIGDISELTAAQIKVGMPTPPPPSFFNILTQFNPDALMMAILFILTALYIRGVVILKKRGDSWPVGRTVAFAIGIALINFATSGGLGVYALFSFEYHMIAHMLLGMIAPIGLVMGAPITLALRTLPQSRDGEERGIRNMGLSLLHSRYSKILTNPVTALALFDGSLFLLYFTDLFSSLMQNHAGHFIMNMHFILVGFLFFSVIIGIDPNPRRYPHILRIVILFAAMSLHAFFSIALMSQTTLIDGGYYESLRTPWLLSALDDQKAGGSIGWAMGEVPMLLALISTFILWMREDKRETVRIDRNEARLAALGEPDELAQYNAYLSKLQERGSKGQ